MIISNRPVGTSNRPVFYFPGPNTCNLRTAKAVNPSVSINFLFRRMLRLGACLGLVVVASAQNTVTPAPLAISDVPRATQIGTGPVPAGAPGNGRYVEVSGASSITRLFKRPYFR